MTAKSSSLVRLLTLCSTIFLSHKIGLVSTFTVSTPLISTSRSSSIHRSIKIPSTLHSKYGDEEEDDEEDEIDLSNQDWRSFRAKLVMQPTSTEDQEEDDLDGIGAALQSSSPTAADLTEWAYDSTSTSFIEKGSVLLGGVEQDFGFGLRQQYFHKVVILILEFEEKKFTKGIILNRPTDMYLDGDGGEWRVWFGGDVQGLGSLLPDVVCLHSLEGEEARKASSTVMKDIQYTTFEGAKKLVKDGHAKPSDFWVFVGYAGWGAYQLQGELERKSWYMINTDSQTVLKQLKAQSHSSDPRNAGLDTWELLMHMINKDDQVKETRNEFDDLMLKEWARDQLCRQYVTAKKNKVVSSVPSTQEQSEASPVDRLLQKVGAKIKGEDVTPGMLLHASSAPRSPFLLDKQEYHKSIVLVIMDDDNLTVGVVLNRPAAKGIDLQIVDKNTMKKSRVAIPLRYGGEYAVKGQAPLLWLHCNDALKKKNVGAPLDPLQDEQGIWKCTTEDATAAIGQGIAKHTDFMIVSGVSIWTKGKRGLARGMQGEIRKGNFDIVDTGKIKYVWDTLQKQELLTDSNLVKNLGIADMAWMISGGDEKNLDSSDEDDDVIEGIGEGFDEDNDSVVFKSDVKVSTLSDDALRNWVATFLLGAPTLG